jgi:tRNA A37 threonylcarbamoyladenosine biosynthesis protein TsaE
MARYLFVPVIIWLNGGFGAGKTTLAEELTAGFRRRSGGSSRTISPSSLGAYDHD